jgi:hypothetical protein
VLTVVGRGESSVHRQHATAESSALSQPVALQHPPTTNHDSTGTTTLQSPTVQSPWLRGHIPGTSTATAWCAGPVTLRPPWNSGRGCASTVQPGSTATKRQVWRPRTTKTTKTKENRPIDFWYRPSVLRKPFNYKGFDAWEKFPITKVPLLLQRKKRRDFSYTNYFQTTFDCH